MTSNIFQHLQITNSTYLLRKPRPRLVVKIVCFLLVLSPFYLVIYIYHVSSVIHIYHILYITYILHIYNTYIYIYIYIYMYINIYIYFYIHPKKLIIFTWSKQFSYDIVWREEKGSCLTTANRSKRLISLFLVLQFLLYSTKLSFSSSGRFLCHSWPYCLFFFLFVLVRLWFSLCKYMHETIIGAGITCNKILL